MTFHPHEIQSGRYDATIGGATLTIIECGEKIYERNSKSFSISTLVREFTNGRSRDWQTV